MLQFEWDPNKAEANFRKHGIEFIDAILIFDGPHITRLSPRSDEVRFASIGYIGDDAVTVVWTPRDQDVRRIISARSARREEREAYREGVAG